MIFHIKQRKLNCNLVLTQHSLKGESCGFPPEILQYQVARLHEGLLGLLRPTWPWPAALPHAQEGAASKGSPAMPCSGHSLSNDMILTVWSQLTLCLCQVIYCIMSVLSFPFWYFQSSNSSVWLEDVFSSMLHVYRQKYLSP